MGNDPINEIRKLQKLMASIQIPKIRTPYVSMLNDLNVSIARNFHSIIKENFDSQVFLLSDEIRKSMTHAMIEIAALGDSLSKTLTLALREILIPENFPEADVPDDVFPIVEELTGTLSDHFPNTDVEEQHESLPNDAGSEKSSAPKFTWRDLLAILSFLIAAATYVQNFVLKDKPDDDPVKQEISITVHQTINYIVENYAIIPESSETIISEE